MNQTPTTSKLSDAEKQRRYRMRLKNKEARISTESMAARDIAMRLRTFKGETITLHIPEPKGDNAEFLWQLVGAIQELEAERRYISISDHLDDQRKRGRNVTASAVAETKPRSKKK